MGTATINYKPTKKNETSFVILIRKIMWEFSRINAFIEQRRNIVNFWSIGFDRVWSACQFESWRVGFTVQKQTVTNLQKRLLAQCAISLIFINAGLYGEYVCNIVRWQWIIVVDSIVNFSILMQSKSPPRILHINPTRELSPVNLSWWHRNVSCSKHKLFVEPRTASTACPFFICG